MITVENLTKYYGPVLAVEGASFSAAKGEIVGFLGPNGAGKTTTIRLLTTYLPPSSGSASVAGYDIVEEAEQVRRAIGYLPEHPPLYQELSVLEYLRFVAQLRGVAPRHSKQRIDEVIESCFLTEVRHKLCGHLSRGYRQRAGIAQAIIHNPKVLILDEPTSGLDPKQIVEIRKLIRSLAGERTVLLSTHQLVEVSTVCSRVVIINRGRIVVDQALSEVTEGLEALFLKAVSGEGE